MISEIISITVSAIISSGIAFAAGRCWERRSANIFRKNIAQDIYAFIDSCTDYQKSFIAYIAKEPKGSVFSPRCFEDKTFISFAVSREFLVCTNTDSKIYALTPLVLNILQNEGKELVSGIPCAKEEYQEKKKKFYSV